MILNMNGGGGSYKAFLSVSGDAGAMVSASLKATGKIMARGAIGSDGTLTLAVRQGGTYTVTATDGEKSQSTDVTVIENGMFYAVDIHFEKHLIENGLAAEACTLTNAVLSSENGVATVMQGGASAHCYISFGPICIDPAVWNLLSCTVPAGAVPPKFISGGTTGYGGCGMGVSAVMPTASNMTKPDSIYERQLRFTKAGYTGTVMLDLTGLTAGDYWVSLDFEGSSDKNQCLSVAELLLKKGAAISKDVEDLGELVEEDFYAAMEVINGV